MTSPWSYLLFFFQVYVVGVTDEVDDNELAMMSSFPHRLDENWWKVAGFAQLNSHYQVNLVADQICKDLGGSPKRQMYGECSATYVPTWSWHQVRQPHIREYEAGKSGANFTSGKNQDKYKHNGFNILCHS